LIPYYDILLDLETPWANSKGRLPVKAEFSTFRIRQFKL